MGAVTTFYNLNRKRTHYWQDLRYTSEKSELWPLEVDSLEACMRRYHILFTLIAVGSLSACATISPVSGKFPPITPHDAQSGAEQGKLVRWGGTLIATKPEASQTCFEVLSLPLSSSGRPQAGRGEKDLGRFLACAPGFYDPTLYKAGRSITFIGTVSGVTKEKVGGYTYPYPKLEASKVYLWPLPRPRRDTTYVSAGWGWGYSPFWWGSPYWY